MPDLDAQTPGRIPPRECIAAARDALSQAYGCANSAGMWPFVLAALDWQRRAIEQLAADEPRSADYGSCEHRASNVNITPCTSGCHGNV